MANNIKNDHLNDSGFFSRLMKLMQTGPSIRRRVKGYDYRPSYNAFGNPYSMSAAGGSIIKKNQNHAYNMINPQGIMDRMARYNDFRAMESMPEIAAGLNVYADESIAVDDKGKCFHITSNNPKVKDLLNELFYDVLNIEYNLRWWTRSLCKYGDFPLLNHIDTKYGVVGVRPIPVNDFEREEHYDESEPWDVRFRWNNFTSDYLKNYQVTHFRLLGNELFYPYGTSILDPARQIWRVLTLAEDAMLTYRIVRCLHGDSKITTDSGYKKIKDIKVGDKVYSYNEETKQSICSNVTDWIDNGPQQIWEVKSKHRTLKTNFNHPVLVRDKKTNLFDYVQVNNLIPKRHQFVMPTINYVGASTQTSLKEENYIWFGHLSLEGREYFRNKKYDRSKLSIEHDVAKKCNYSASRIDQFLYYVGKKIKGIPYDIAIETCNAFDIPLNCLIKYPRGIFNIERIDLPQIVDKEFARFFGFMIGDGFMTKNLHKIGFATRLDQSNNQYYFDIFKKYCSSAAFVQDKRNKNAQIGRVEANTCYFSHIMKNLGFTSNVHTKQIPKWIFTSSDEIKEAFIDGLVDAVGHIRTQRKTESMELELCNSQIIEGVKELCHQLGWNVSANVKKRNRKVDRLIAGNKTLTKMTTSYSIYMTKIKTGLYEDIWSVTPTNEYDNVYDIRVDNSLHNFIADGCVVHNSPERRVFYVDVANVPPGEIPTVVEEVKKNFHSTQVIDPATGRVDNRWDSQPVWCKSPIPLLDGRTITIEDLAKEYDNDKENWVFSVKDDTLETAPGKVVWCGKNYTANKLIKVWLDDNTWVMTAPEHPFVMRNGSSKRADELLPNDALLSFYAKLSTKKDGMNIEGYKNHKVDHIEVVTSESGEDVYCMTVTGPNGEEDRHNFATLSCSDEKNIEISGSFVNKSAIILKNSLLEDYVIPVRGSDSATKIDTLSGGQNTTAVEDVEYLQKKLFAALQIPKPYLTFDDALSCFVPETEVALLDGRNVSMENIKKELLEGKELWTYSVDLDTKEIVPGKIVNSWNAKTVDKLVKVTLDNGESFKCTPEHKWLGCDGVYIESQNLAVGTPLMPYRLSTDTKVMSIELLNETRAVWDIEVAKYHNFALAKSVIVSNSKAGLAQEDVRFSRTINMIQKVIIAELNKLAIIHLFANGFDGEDLLNFDLQLSNPSTLAQQQKLELWRSKLEIAKANYDPEQNLISRSYVQKHILSMSKDEMTENDNQILDDKKFDTKVEETKMASSKMRFSDQFDKNAYEYNNQQSGSVPPSQSGSANQPINALGAGEQEIKINKPSNETELDNFIKISPTGAHSPIKPEDRVQYNWNRRRTHGASTTHMPDFNAMFDRKNVSLKDIYDKDFLGGNPFKEGVEPVNSRQQSNADIDEQELYSKTSISRPNATNEIKEMLRTLSKDMPREQSSENILTEALDDDDPEIDLFSPELEEK